MAVSDDSFETLLDFENFFLGDRLNADLTKARRPALNLSELLLDVSLSSSDPSSSSTSLALL
jgi:hypothetical protein